VGPMGFLDP